MNAVVPAKRQMAMNGGAPGGTAEPAINAANTLTTTQYTNHCDRVETREPLQGGITVSRTAGPRFIFSLNSGERISAGLAGRGRRESPGRMPLGRTGLH